MKIERVLVVYSKSLYQIYVKEHRERSIKQAIRRGDTIAHSLRSNHEAQLASLEAVKRTLDRLRIDHVCRWRAHVRSSRRFDLVISLGGDGTLLDISHRICDETPLLGINSDPRSSVGALCSGITEDLPRLLEALASQQLAPKRVSRIRLRVDGREVLGPTLNDVLYAHGCPAGLSRFDMALVPADDARLLHSGFNGASFVELRGSGLWVSTATGSTAAIHSAGGKIMPPTSRRLQYLVREPYLVPGRKAGIKLRGEVLPGQAIVLVPRVRRGSIWADGPYRSHVVSYSQQVIIDRHPADLLLVRQRR